MKERNRALNLILEIVCKHYDCDTLWIAGTATKRVFSDLPDLKVFLDNAKLCFKGQAWSLDMSGRLNTLIMSLRDFDEDARSLLVKTASAEWTVQALQRQGYKVFYLFDLPNEDELRFVISNYKIVAARGRRKRGLLAPSIVAYIERIENEDKRQSRVLPRPQNDFQAGILYGWLAAMIAPAYKKIDGERLDKGDAIILPDIEPLARNRIEAFVQVLAKYFDDKRKTKTVSPISEDAGCDFIFGGLWMSLEMTRESKDQPTYATDLNALVSRLYEDMSATTACSLRTIRKLMENPGDLGKSR